MSADKPVDVYQVARRFRLPPRWLRAEAKAGRIPCLKVGKRLLFNMRAVAEALAARAAEPRATEGVPRGK